MSITVLLGQLGQLGGLQSMARELGVPESQVTRGADALLPAILGGLGQQAQSRPGGVEGLGGLLRQLGGGRLFDEVLSPQPTPVEHGNEVLGQLFGSKAVSRAVAQNAATRSGLDAGLLQRMLPLLAMLVAGYAARAPGGGAAEQPVPATDAGDGRGAMGGLGGLLGGLAGGLLGGGPAAAGPSGGAGAGPVGGLGGLAALLDANRDGNPLDDILRLMGQGQARG